MKRIKNKIEGVRPFNLFTLRSCYYYQTVAGLASFGIPYENILMGYLSFPQKNFQIEKKSFSDKEMGKIWGYKSKACNLSLRGFLRNIDKHNPVIAGIDCFYVESRPEAYRKKHSPHWILVHGYDLDIMTKTVSFTGEFITLWLTSSSLSLAIYAFIEKFIPSKKKILSAEEIRKNEEMIDSIKSILTADKISEEAEESTAIASEVNEEKQDLEAAGINATEPQATESMQGKIILRGRKNV